ncbi:MAG: hypothetical protein II499_03045, partial [Firmicutes bacterium]|nr:hypothetical protein [Bacillota bacterium]
PSTTNESSYIKIPWDTMVGVARRSWARNENAMAVAAEYNLQQKGLDHITLPFIADDEVVKKALEK